MAIVQRSLQIRLKQTGQAKATVVAFSGINPQVSDEVLLAAAQGLATLLKPGETAFSKVEISALA